MILLSVKNIYKHYGGIQAVQDISFAVNKGEIVGIIGPNGAGKTTTFKLIAGFEKVDKGEIILRGAKVHNLLPHEVCGLGIARTFQQGELYLKLTVFENVLVSSFKRHASRNEAERKTEEVLELLGLGPIAGAFPSDLTIADRKRIEIARALATEPELLLLDEVMAGLTGIEIKEAINLILKIAQKCDLTLLMIEHVMKAVMSLSHRIIVMQYGQKIAEGPPEEVSANKQVIDAYLGEDVLYA